MSYTHHSPLTIHHSPLGLEFVFTHLLLTNKNKTIMPGKETEGYSNNEPAANKASKQNSEKNTLPNEYIDPKYEPEVTKAYQKNVGSNKSGNDTRENHDSNTRQVGS